MAGYRQFKRNVNNDFGFEHDNFKSAITQFAMRDPADYHILINMVQNNLKEIIVKQMYYVLYDVLKDGEYNGRSVALASTTVGSLTYGKHYTTAVDDNTMINLFKPNISEEEVDKKAKGAAMEVSKILCKIVNDILPLPERYTNIPMNKGFDVGDELDNTTNNETKE